MTPPNPQVVERLLDDIRQRLDGLEDAYKWLYPAAYDRGGRTDVGARYQLNRIGDPAGETAVDFNQQDMRDKLDTVGKKISEANKSLQGAGKALSEASGILSGKRNVLPSEHDHRIPRTASRREVDEAKWAQSRRQRRGEGYGVG